MISHVVNAGVGATPTLLPNQQITIQINFATVMILGGSNFVLAPGLTLVIDGLTTVINLGASTTTALQFSAQAIGKTPSGGFIPVTARVTNPNGRFSDQIVQVQYV